MASAVQKLIKYHKRDGPKVASAVQKLIKYQDSTQMSGVCNIWGVSWATLHWVNHLFNLILFPIYILIGDSIRDDPNDSGIYC